MDDKEHSKRLETNQEETWIALRQFYAKNRASIERSKELNVGKGRFLEDLDQVLQASQVLLDGLVPLANIHPIFGAAIFAFHGIIKLDVTRRENNRKVLAVKLQMQSMMSAMFQMCELKHVHVLDDPQKSNQRAQLQELVEAIADDIKQCGSDLNYYSDRKILSKLIKAHIYERRLAEHVETFAQRRSELQTTITAYISAGIDAANIAISSVRQKVNVVDKKIDSLLAVFQRLDTPIERELQKFMTDNGGAEKCINEDDLLQELLAKTGQIADSVTETRKTLRVELSEDLEKALSQNLSRFERVLAMNLEDLSNQIERQAFNLQDHTMKLDKLYSTSIAIQEEGKLIRRAIIPNTLITLKDPEMQQLWHGMGHSARRSVKAKQFVLTLRDHLDTADRSMIATPELRSALALVDEGSPEVLSFSDPNSQASLQASDDAWALEHINAAHVQPIIEAMDEDGSGFISVQEANKFALSRPKGMKLLHWIAYWAAGWQYNLTDYRSKIYRIMQRLHNISSNVLPVNRKMVDIYLDDRNYFRIESIVRFTVPASSEVPRDPRLANIASKIATLQEERLRMNLQKLSYVLRSPADVTLVTGSGRLETWLLPLLYVVLARHLEVFRVAQFCTLNPDEIWVHLLSVRSIMEIYDRRMQRLKDIFRPSNRDSEAHFRIFSYGLFLGAYKWTGTTVAEGNTLLSFHDNLDASEDDLETNGHRSHDTSVLVYGPGDAIEYHTLEEWANELASRSSIRDRHVFSDVHVDSDNDVHSENNAHTDNNVETNLTSLAHFSPSLPLHADNNIDFDHDAEPHVRGLQPNPLTRSVDVDNDVSQFVFASTHNTDEDVSSVSKGYFSTGVEGHWVGTYANNTDMPPFAWIVQPVADGRVVGVGRDYQHRMDIAGKYDKQTGHIEVTVDCAGYSLKLEGTYNRSEDTINGRWTKSSDSLGKSRVWNSTFTMTRHSVSGFRFRSLLDAAEGRTSLARRRWAFAIEAVLVQKTTRPSVSAFRFRNLLDAGEGRISLARARWAFAIEAVLSDVQETMGSWDLMRSRVKERNDWIQIDLLKTLTFGQTRGFWDNEDNARWHYIRSVVHPATLAVYNLMGEYFLQRSWYHIGDIRCDVCRQFIVFRRHICITCIEDDYSDWVDFCVDSDCSEDKPIATDIFVHSSSHSLLRCTEGIPVYELPRIISKAKIISERIKKLFSIQKVPKDRTLAKAFTNPLDSVPDSPKCSHCSASLSLPCWVCAVCPGGDLLLCLQCETSFEIPLAPRGALPYGHSRSHHLLRITDSAEAKMVKKSTLDSQLNDTAVTKMSDRFNGLELRVEERISKLEKKLDEGTTQMALLETKVDSLETKVDSLLLLLQQVVAEGETGKGN